MDWYGEITHLLLMKKSISTFKQFEELELLQASFTTQYFKPHFHHQYALILLESGRVDYSYKDQVRHMEGGSILLLNPYEVHTGKSIDGGTWRFRSLYISQQLFRSLYGKTTKQVGFPAFAQAVLHDPPFIRQFTKVHEYLLTETEEKTAQSAVGTLVQALVGVCHFEILQSEWPVIEEKVSAIKAYLDAHYLETIRLDELAKELGLSKYYLIRQFESVYGLSPNRYAINLRIEEAKRLLHLGMKNTEVAYTTGFYDQSHFIRHFKMIVGVTPKSLFGGRL